MVPGPRLWMMTLHQDNNETQSILASENSENVYRKMPCSISSISVTWVTFHSYLLHFTNPIFHRYESHGWFTWIMDVDLKCRTVNRQSINCINKLVNATNWIDKLDIERPLFKQWVTIPITCQFKLESIETLEMNRRYFYSLTMCCKETYRW